MSQIVTKLVSQPFNRQRASESYSYATLPIRRVVRPNRPAIDLRVYQDAIVHLAYRVPNCMLRTEPGSHSVNNSPSLPLTLRIL